MEYLNGRRIVIKALTGSHNYGLNTATSDKDYKYFVMPTFEDLYRGNFFSDSHNSPELDYTVHDVRKLPELLFKSNINFMEVLFSVEEHHDPIVDFLFYDRERTARMNLPYLYDACVGMHKTKYVGMMRGESDQAKASIERFGYDLKQATHSYRAIDFLRRYALFGSFKLAVDYIECGDGANEIWDIRRGRYDVYGIGGVLCKQEAILETLRPFYVSKDKDDEWYNALKYDMEKAVKEEVRRELK